MRRTRDYGKTNSSWYILGFIRLPFNKEEKEAVQTSSEIAKKEDIRVVTAKSGLNCRKNASTSAKIVYCYEYNKPITILQISKNGKWGKTDKG